MDYVVERESMSSIQGELIPLLVKAQFRHVRSIPSGPYSRARRPPFLAAAQR